MANVSDWAGKQLSDKPVEEIADKIVMGAKGDGGYFFVTHTGELIGPDPDRDLILTKALLYLASEKKE